MLPNNMKELQLWMRRKGPGICDSATLKVAEGRVEASALITSVKHFLYSLLPLLSLNRTHN